ncbi:MAG: NHL repeat-containing protein [Candidatus Riflebacteria bacterium]|nr:NHL repeat-containing protein [Candidatus Riflebacteria bacterium]
MKRMFVFIFVVLIFFAGTMYGASDQVLNLVIEEVGKNVHFKFSLASDGCFAVSGQVKGKNHVERLWGPSWLTKGTHCITLPASAVAEKSGVAEFFSVDFSHEFSVGRPGKGERQFVKPMGIGWDNVTKNLYVADTGNDRIVRLDSYGRFVSQYGGFGVAFGDKTEEKEDSLDEPWDVAPGGFSNFYLSDRNNNRIAEFDAYKSFKGNLFPKANDLKNRLNRPKGLFVDGENCIWIADSRADRVIKVAPSGEKLLEIGGFGWSQWKFKEPVQVAVDNYGTVFVADRGNRRIQIFDRLGSRINEIKDDIKSPVGIAVDNDGLIYVCDDEKNELSVFSIDGKKLRAISGISSDDPFRGPCDLVVLDEILYLLDSRNNRIVAFERKKNSIQVSWELTDTSKVETP